MHRRAFGLWALWLLAMVAAALLSWWCRREDYRAAEAGERCARAVDWLLRSDKYLRNGSILNTLSDTLGGPELISISAPSSRTTTRTTTSAGTRPGTHSCGRMRF